MKSKIMMMLLFIAIISACNSNYPKNNGEEEHKHVEIAEDIVMLNKQQRDALGLQLGTFEMRNLTILVKTNGQLEVPPAATADVTAVIGGNVKEIKVFHGDMVNKGQVLAVLEHPDYISLQEDFAEMANKLDFLEQEYNRQKELFENNVGAGKDFQQVKSELNTVNAKYEGLKSRLHLLYLSPEDVKKGEISSTIPIVSPIHGYVNEVNIKLGTYVDSKDKLFNITDNREIHADFMVYENDVNLLKPGQKIDITVANRPGEELSATIFAIGKEFDPNLRAVHIHARLDNNPGDLIPGMYVSGHIHAEENYVRTLPNDAVVTEGTKSYIFILDKSVTRDEKEDTKKESPDIPKFETNSQTLGFKMVEVLAGMQEGNYTEINLLDSLPESANVVMNAAYYLLADIKKNETEHEH